MFWLVHWGKTKSFWGISDREGLLGLPIHLLASLAFSVLGKIHLLISQFCRSEVWKELAGLSTQCLMRLKSRCQVATLSHVQVPLQAHYSS